MQTETHLHFHQYVYNWYKDNFLKLAFDFFKNLSPERKPNKICFPFLQQCADTYKIADVAI